MPSLAIRSMFGVRYPISPFVKTLRFDCPMSSPQMTRMFGFFAGACASAGASQASSATARLMAPTAYQTRKCSHIVISHLPGHRDLTIVASCRRKGSMAHRRIATGPWSDAAGAVGGDGGDGLPAGPLHRELHRPLIAQVGRAQHLTGLERLQHLEDLDHVGVGRERHPLHGELHVASDDDLLALNDPHAIASAQPEAGADGILHDLLDQEAT